MEHEPIDSTGDAQLGTRWVAAGKGARVKALIAASWPHDRGAPRDAGTRHAFMRLCKFDKLDRTNLALTGRPLVAEDLERIARCEVAK